MFGDDDIQRLKEMVMFILRNSDPDILIHLHFV